MEETIFFLQGNYPCLKYFCLIRGQKTPEHSVAFKACSQKSPIAAVKQKLPHCLLSNIIMAIYH